MSDQKLSQTAEGGAVRRLELFFVGGLLGKGRGGGGSVNADSHACVPVPAQRGLALFIGLLGKAPLRYWLNLRQCFP